MALLSCTLTAHAQFQIQDSHSTASFRGVHSLGNGIAWVSGTEGTVLRTTDDGTTWQRCATPPNADNLDFRGIQAFDQNTAIVMSSGLGDLSRLYKTTDACKTWKLVFTNPDKDGFWDAIQFSDKDHNFGVLLGDPVKGIFVVLVTFNGGERWERQTLEATQDINGESVFAASNSSLLISHPGYRRFCTGGSGGPRVIRLGAGSSNTSGPMPEKSKWDAGLLAERLKSFKQRPSSGCFSIAEDPSGVTVAVGGDYMEPNDSRYTAWTSSRRKSQEVDERFEFHLANSPPHGYRSSVAYDASTRTWITVGPNGTDISRDDGKNWNALKPAAQDAPDADKNWNALSLPFVVGPHGRIGKLRPETLKP
ncbi:WD40/YVTN/BNR-like repeat-containing protein [Edaphobacter sp. HDX4]|uniref:WD40/YVTN/BNR-like repeat-containing protein n=1 Tax=Edaphobacter sp. HDX4 TaxID=2794064 RepID=UPI002FE52B8E